jgi:FkbM family methyltransferase
MNSGKLQNYTIFYQNSEEYHRLKREVFTSDLYYFESTNHQPKIIDAGAHIGLATLYFKQIFPGAVITALEPNPESFNLLEKNIFENQLDDVTALQIALSNQEGQETLFLDESSEKWHSTASFHQGSWVGSQKSTQVLVRTQTLDKFIDQPIDFLKLDIEGAEQKVLFHAQDKLYLVKEMHIEFHTHPSQSLEKLVELLEETHKLELFKGTQIIPLKKAKGLVHIRAYNKKTS